MFQIKITSLPRVVSWMILYIASVMGRREEYAKLLERVELLGANEQEEDFEDKRLGDRVARGI